MSRFTGLSEKDAPHNIVKPGPSHPAKKIGILLVNLGTPDEPTPSALKRYLGEFLWDRRVVEIPRLVWWFILRIILFVKPKKSAALYKSIWQEDGSPLLAISRQQQDKLQLMIKQDLPSHLSAEVKLGMRYGNPSITKALREFRDNGYNKLVILPLYPQYSGATTGSTFDALAKELLNWRWVPELHFINEYVNHPSYIQSMVNSIQEYVDTHGKPNKLVLSYHGLPKLFLELGDPYYCYCMKTTRLIMEQLKWDDNDYVTTFQSRFGKAEWLKPYTSETLETLAKEGCDKVAVVCPAFSADCLETLEEISGENKEVFLEAGGKTFDYIPCLNDRDDHILSLKELIDPYLS